MICDTLVDPLRLYCIEIYFRWLIHIEKVPATTCWKGFIRSICILALLDCVSRANAVSRAPDSCRPLLSVVVRKTRCFSETIRRITAKFSGKVAIRHISRPFFFRFFKILDFLILTIFFFVFVNMGPCGSENFKTLLLPQFILPSQSLVAPTVGVHNELWWPEWPQLWFFFNQTFYKNKHLCDSSHKSYYLAFWKFKFKVFFFFKEEIFINMGDYGSGNFKRLLLLQ